MPDFSTLAPDQSGPTMPAPGEASFQQLAPSSLYDRAVQQYPVLKKYDIGFKNNIGGGDGYMESWSPSETGTPDRPRPAEFPIGKFGVENYRADSKPSDVIADVVSHHLINVDPTVKAAYSKFAGSLQPFQQQILQDQYAHAQKNEGETRPFDSWKANTGVPGYFRGYAFQQWPSEFNDRAYTPEQKQGLDSMVNYLKAGK